MDPIFSSYIPTNIKGLISIPHAGEAFPEEFLPYLTKDKRALAEDVDFAVDQLIDIEKLVNAGIAIIVAKVHRTCLDLNRPPEKACLNWKENTQGVPLVMQEPNSDTTQKLTEKYHTPYYNKLTEIIHNNQQTNRIFPVIDLHSMPSRPTAHHLKLNPQQKTVRPDACISDLKGKSCSADYIDEVVEFLNSNGVKAAKNDPYFGGYLTQFMAPLPCNNIQIEINRHIYMDEKNRTLIPEKVAQVQPIFTRLALQLLTR